MADIDYSKAKEVSLHAVDYLQVMRNRWKEIFLTFLLVFMAAAVVTYLLPPTYRATARFEIRSPRTAIEIMSSRGGTVVERTASSNYLPTQFEVVSSPETLKYVAKNLNLSKEWGIPEEAAAQRLKSMVEVVPIRNTDLVDVYARGGDPKLVQSIAEGVVSAYKKRREMEENEFAYAAINKLRETLQMAKDERITKNHQLQALIGSGNYIGSNLWMGAQDTAMRTTEGEDEAHQAAQEEIRRLEREVNELKTHIAEIEKLPDDQLLGYVISANILSAESYGSDNLRQMYKEYQERLRDRESLIAMGYGPNHIRVQTVEETIKNLKADLDAALVGLRTSLVSRQGLLTATLEDKRKFAEDLKRALQEKTLRDNELMEAIRAYSVALEKEKEMERTLIVEAAQLRIPRVAIVVQEHALTPQAPVSPKISLNLAIGAGAGLILGFIVAFLLEYFDTSVKTVEEVERSLGVPVIGVVPKDIKMFYKEPGESPDVEAYRILRTNIELAKKGINEVAISFVSGTAGEGKTTTLCNLAYVYAQAGYTTLMIDADMRRSKLNQHFDLDNSYGLSNYLTSDITLEDVVMETELENLYILPAGPTPRDPSGLLSTRKMADLLREAKNRFDIVLVDSPPILGVSDSAIIVRAADVTVMVVQPRKLSEKVLRKEKDVIETSGGNLVGVVLNNVDIGSDHQYQYYTTYYMYTPGQGNSKKEKKRSNSPSKLDSQYPSETASNSSRSSNKDMDDLY